MKRTRRPVHQKACSTGHKNGGQNQSNVRRGYRVSLIQWGNPNLAELLLQFCDEAQTCCNEDWPASTDSQKAANPCIARFGKANWKEEIKKTSFLTQYVCISEMVEHIVVKSARMFKAQRMKPIGCSTMMHSLL
jgi:hypothetical protein